MPVYRRPRKRPDLCDIHLGARIKLRRKSAGWSRSKLGAHIGLTAREVQKLESGATPFSAPVLYCIARELNAPVGYFFTGLDKILKLPPVVRGSFRPEFVELLTAYSAIPNGLGQPLHELLTGLVERGHSLP